MSSPPHACVRWLGIISDEHGCPPTFPGLHDDHETVWRLDRLDGPSREGAEPLKISARNQLAGTVKTVTEGAVMCEVVVDVSGGHEVVAAITAESAHRLGLAPGTRVVVIIKSTEVMLAVDD